MLDHAGNDTPSAGEPQALAALTQRPIRFETPMEFQARPLWRDGVEGKEHKLVRIVGGYSFAKAYYLHCGLKGCRQTHGTGFVVLLDRDVETNIGHCCGLTHYGMDWQAMESTFAKAERAFIIQDLIDKAARNRQATLKQAAELQEAVAAANVAIGPILKVLAAERKIAKAFEDCQRAHGALTYFRELTEDERAMAHGQKNAVVRVGRIDGIVAAKPQELERELKFKVLIPLQEWQPVDAANVTQRQLEEQIRSINALGDVIQRAQIFVEQAQRFRSTDNWVKLEQFCVESRLNLSRATMNDVRELAGLPRRNW